MIDPPVVATFVFTFNCLPVSACKVNEGVNFSTKSILIEALIFSFDSAYKVNIICFVKAFKQVIVICLVELSCLIDKTPSSILEASLYATLYKIVSVLKLGSTL